MRHKLEGVNGLMTELDKFNLSFADLGREEYQGIIYHLCMFIYG